MRTNFPKESGESATAPKDSPNISGQVESEDGQNVKYPKRLRYKGKGRVWATIYQRPNQAQPYRLYWRARVDGKPRSMFKDFGTYSEAKQEGDKVVARLAKGSQAAALSPGQARDALAAFERLQAFHVATGRRVSLFAGISEFCDVAERLHAHGRTLSEAADGYLSTAATLKRKDLAQAVEDFITAEEPRTKASEGQRAQLSAKYAYNRAIMLRRFAGAFPNHAVCDLAKEHLDAFIAGLARWKSKSRNGKPVNSAKGRNHHRAAIRQFLQWAVRKDYLPMIHRLGEADAMRPEHANNGETEFYTPGEFKALLDVAEGPMRAMLAIGGLAGLRTAELMRLTWQDVWRVENHIEVTAGKAKTRQRRLVEICPALAAWLEPFRPCEQGKVCELHEITWQQHFVALCEKARVEIKGKHVPVTRKPNGLRHAFCTYHFAAHGNENLTAQQAGNSPAMVHQHYKGLATKKEAEAWFAVAPEQAENVIPIALDV
jgi:integrase